MINSKKAETIVSIIVWILILSFIILTLSKVLIQSKENIETFNNYRISNLLKNNTSNIVSKLNTENIKENEFFYLYKNDSSQEFQVLTWVLNDSNQFINKYWDKIDVNTFDWVIYKRLLWLEKEDNSIDWEKNQIIKAEIKRLIEQR